MTTNAERLFWTILAIIALLAAAYFAVVERDNTTSGAASLIALVLLQFRAGAPFINP